MKSQKIFLLANVVAVLLLSLRDARAGYTAHEWGTFTSVQGGDGELLPWRPLKSSDLPGFVHDWTKPGLNRYSSGMFVGKGEMVTLQRMETPVIYFYPSQAMNVDVSVGFPKGLITEWYPQATQIGPSLSGNTNLATALDSTTPESKAIWKNLSLTPVRQPTKYRQPVNTDKSGSHYYSARETDSSMVQMVFGEEAPAAAPVSEKDVRTQLMAGKSQPAPAVETERFVFYRGAGSFKTPLVVKVNTNSPITPETAGKSHPASLSDPEAVVVTVENTGAEDLKHLFLVSVHDGNGAFEPLSTLAAGKTAHRIALNPSPNENHILLYSPLKDFQSRIGAQMAAALTSEGLFPREAKAMVVTWKDSWFAEEGDRVLYILPRAWTDETLPMTLEPQPEKLVRVMVGRAEIITPKTQMELAAALSKARDGDSSARAQAIERLRALGRFAEPAWQMVNVRSNSSPAGIYGHDLLREAAIPGSAQLEQLYLSWHGECETIRLSSNTMDYIGLPSFGNIINVGKPALPYLVEKMKADQGMDFMLAYAVCKICGWDYRDYQGGGEQSFRDRILKKLEETQTNEQK